MNLFSEELKTILAESLRDKTLTPEEIVDTLEKTLGGSIENYGKNFGTALAMKVLSLFK
jgi:hypothetical protein